MSKSIKQNVTRPGFSLVEVLLAAVIMSVLLVAAVRLFGNLGTSLYAATDQDAADMLAIEMIREIKNQNYSDPNTPDNFGIDTGEEPTDRATFNDIDDYHNWLSTPPGHRDGRPYNRYGHLTRSVEVLYVDASDFENTVSDDQGFKKVIITVMQDERQLAQHIYVIADTQCLCAESPGN